MFIRMKSQFVSVKTVFSFLSESSLLPRTGFSSVWSDLSPIHTAHTHTPAAVLLLSFFSKRYGPFTGVRVSVICKWTEKQREPVGIFFLVRPGMVSGCVDGETHAVKTKGSGLALRKSNARRWRRHSMVAWM